MSKLVSQISLAIRWVFCFVAAFLNAVAIGFQGNGNLIATGLLIGLALGAVWSVLLVFATPAWVRHFRPSLKTALTGALLIAALFVLPIVSFHLWGHAISFAPWANERSALGARTALCFHIEACWPGASESERWAALPTNHV